jgi:dTMP kinase
MIIAIEGGDGCGKATQAKLLADHLNAELLSFPNYETPTGKLILRHLKQEWGCRGFALPDEKVLDATVFQCLQTINRFEVLAAIKAHIAEGRNLVFDRYYGSALVYGGLDGVNIGWIEDIQAPLPEPDVWLLLDVPVEESFKRRPERRDRYEANREYLEKVRTEYLRLFGVEERLGKIGDSWSSFRQHWFVVNGQRSVAEVQATINEIVGGRK